MSVATVPTTSQNVNPFSISYEFAAFPMSLVGLRIPSTAKDIYAVLYDCIRRGLNDPSISYLADRVKCCYRQALRSLDLLEKIGRIRRHRRRISATRNDTNVYEIVGFSVRNVTEKIKSKVIKTKAPRPAAPASSPSSSVETDQKTTIQRLKNKLASVAQENLFLKNFLKRGQHIVQAQQWRSERKQRDMRLCSQAKVGNYIPPPEEAEAYARREDECRRLTDAWNLAWVLGDREKQTALKQEFELWGIKR